MHAAGWPAGTVTFLFTDIVGSTRLWETVPDMEARVASHLAILHAAVSEHHGVVFSEMGDGIAAAFSSAHSAVCAAIDAQRAPPDGVIVARMGIHTGDATPRDDDYLGPAVNRAARVMAIAHGGQIVLTQSSADLLRTSPVEGVDLIDLGMHRLRDLSEPEQISQIVHPSLTARFPPLRSLGSYIGNLPAQRTTFFGRNEQLARLDELLSTRRLVTLTGVGGAGKTRLALHAAAESVPRFPGGAWLIELASTGDAASVAAVARTALGASTLPGADDTDAVCAHLGSRSSLVILDNCEHVLDAASDLAVSMLERCPNVVVLATSREGLDVSGEQLVAIRALDCVDEAVELFIDRARSVEPDLHLGEADIELIGEVCTRLDGLPLAIELAAARVATTTLTDIAAGLDDRFRVLAGGRRRSIERHQTMRAAIEWSHHLLDDDERMVLRRLAVFAGGFTRDAACAVCGSGSDERVVRDAVESLVRKSMVQFDRERNRYRLLETVRAYALERLGESGEAHATSRAHAEWMATLVDHPLEVWYGPRGVELVAAAIRELDNWREASAYATQIRDVVLGSRLCRHLLGGDRPETARWAEDMLRATAGSSDDSRRWMHWAAATGFIGTLENDACEAHLDAFEALATSEAERAWPAPFRAVIAEVRTQNGAEVIRRALEVPDLAPTQRGFMLILLALLANLPPNSDVDAATVAVAEAERLDHYTTPLAYAFLAMSVARVDVERASEALARAEALAERHPSVFIRASVAGWGSITLVELPTAAAAEHLLVQVERLQGHWTNAHVGLLATCYRIVRRTDEAAATRIAAFLVEQSGAEVRVRGLCPELETAALPPSTDDFDSIMALVREDLTQLANAEE